MQKMLRILKTVPTRYNKQTKDAVNKEVKRMSTDDIPGHAKCILDTNKTTVCYKLQQKD